jgi:enoyl-CoA hydratase/carnithine racemase
VRPADRDAGCPARLPRGQARPAPGRRGNAARAARDRPLAHRLARHVGRADRRRARRGLVDFLVDDLDEGVAQIAGTLANQSPNALREIKQLLLATRDERSDDLESQAFARCLASDEGKEGVAAFLEKRKPRWAAES